MQNYTFNKNISSEFSWTNLTWFWWLLSIWEFFNTVLNLDKLLERAMKNAIKDEWNPKKIKHRRFKVIMQKIYLILVWIKTNNADKYIKNDPIFKALLWEIVPNEPKEKYKESDYSWKFEWVEKKWRKIFSLKTVQTFRLELFNIPARAIKTWRKLLFRFEKTFGWRELYNNIIKIISLLPKLQFS